MLEHLPDPIRRVFVKLRGDRTIAGQLHVSCKGRIPRLTSMYDTNAQAYDAHMNLVLGGAEETIHTVDVSEDGQPQPPRVRD
jgi:U6 snRNA-associated Sm-like protein LSm3